MPDFDRRQSINISHWLTVIQSGVALLSMLIAGVAWGLKLEGKIDVLNTRHEAQEQRIVRLQAEHDALHGLIDALRLEKSKRTAAALVPELESLR